MSIWATRQNAVASHPATAALIGEAALWMGENILRDPFDGAGDLAGSTPGEGGGNWTGPTVAGGGWSRAGGTAVMPNPAGGALSANYVRGRNDPGAGQVWLASNIRWSATPDTDKIVHIGFRLPASGNTPIFAVVDPNPPPGATSTGGMLFDKGWTLQIRSVPGSTSSAAECRLFKGAGDGQAGVVPVATGLINGQGAVAATSFTDVQVLIEGAGTPTSPTRIRVRTGSALAIDWTDAADQWAANTYYGLGVWGSTFTSRVTVPTLEDLVVSPVPNCSFTEFYDGFGSPSSSTVRARLAPVVAGATWQLNVRSCSLGAQLPTDWPDQFVIYQKDDNGAALQTPNTVNFTGAPNAHYVIAGAYAATHNGAVTSGLARYGLFELYLELNRTAAVNPYTATSADASARSTRGYYVAKATATALAVPSANPSAYPDVMAFGLTTTVAALRQANWLLVRAIEAGSTRSLKTATQAGTANTSTEIAGRLFDMALAGVGLRWTSVAAAAIWNSDPYLVFASAPAGWRVTGTESEIVERSTSGTAFTEDAFNVDPRAILGAPAPAAPDTTSSVYNRGQVAAGLITVVNARGEGFVATDRLRVANVAAGTGIEAHAVALSETGVPPAPVTQSYAVTFDTAVGVATADGLGQPKFLVWDNTADPVNTPTAVSARFARLDSTYALTRHLQLNDKVLALSKSVIVRPTSKLGYFSLLVRDRRGNPVANVASMAGTLTLADDGDQVDPVAGANLRTNADGFIVDRPPRNLLAFVWSSLLPDGGWDLYLSDPLVHDGNSTALARKTVGQFDFTLLSAYRDNLAVEVSIGLSTAVASTGRLPKPGDTVVVRAAPQKDVANNGVFSRLAVDAGTIPTVRIRRLNQATNALVDVVGSDAGGVGMTLSGADSGVWTYQWTTASTLAADVYVAFVQCSLDGGVKTGYAQTLVAGPVFELDPIGLALSGVLSQR